VVRYLLSVPVLGAGILLLALLVLAASRPESTTTPALVMFHSPFSISLLACVTWVLLPFQLLTLWRITRREKVIEALQAIALNNVATKAWADLSATRFVLGLVVGCFLTVFWLIRMRSEPAPVPITLLNTLVFLLENWLVLHMMLTFDAAMALYVVISTRSTRS
jgi:hypothetical protein